MNPFACISAQTLYHESGVNCFVLHENWLYTGSEKHLTRWNFEKGELANELELAGVKKIEIQQNSKKLFVFAGEKIQAFDLELNFLHASEPIPDVEFFGLIPTAEMFFVVSRSGAISTYKNGQTVDKVLELPQVAAEGAKIKFAEGARHSNHLFLGFGNTLLILSVSNGTLEVSKEIVRASPVLGAMDVDQQSMAFLQTDGWAAFQKDCEAPYFDSEALPENFKPLKICGFEGKYFYIISEQNEVNIWNFYTQHDVKLVPSIKDMTQFQLVGLSRLIISYNGEDPRVEIKEMLITEEPKLTLDADYFRGTILNYRKENRVEELMDDVYFRGFYVNNERNGPATLIRKNQKIICNYKEGWICGPIEIIELNNNRLKIVGVADYFLENYSDIAISHLEVNGIKIESNAEGTPITTTSFSGPAKLTFKNGTVVKAILQNNVLKPDQQDPFSTIQTASDETPATILNVIGDNRVVDDQSREFTIDFQTGEIEESAVEI